jgi:orotidine-5'-phosphate decarboxylase
MRTYGERLGDVVRSRGPLCVGIDPHPRLVEAWGLPADARGLERFARGVVEAVGDLAAVFKPQSAFYEAHGAAGIAVLERVLADVRGTGALALLDVKRGDIGSTMDAYAVAYLADGAPLAADAITLSPYLGFDSLAGAIELAGRTGRGVYVLALTSNPEGPTIQHGTTADGRMVGQHVLDKAAAHNPGPGPGHVGVVVGATIGRTGADFSRLNASILAPGLGVQGGTAGDLAEVFGPALPFVLPAMSRELLREGPDPARLRRAVSAAVGDLSSAVGVR